MQYSFPRLYKKTSTGAIQFWDISIEHNTCGADGPIGAGRINVRHGQLDTPNPQETFDIISEGKNVGKKNETSPYEQAEKEAQSRWEKKKKSGYVDTLDSAHADEVDDLIEGGVEPMLAQSYAKHAKKIVFPCVAQPKLDGIRCIAILKNGKCTLWSRTRKLITGVPHISREIEEKFKGTDKEFILDGELYNHELKKDFEQIVSHVRQETPQPGHEIVQYHVYDMVSDQPYNMRQATVGMLLLRMKHLHKVPSHLMLNSSLVAPLFSEFLRVGYEGLMLRNAESPYVNKRSYDLQKVKEFDEAEFKIVGIKQGRGKLMGHAIHICVNDQREEFDVKLKGDTAVLKKHYEDHSLWKGKKMTVQYQGLTGANGVPRFPVGKAIRDYE